MGKKGKRENMIVGLDIGTTKICAIVGEGTDSGLDIVGIGTHPSKGMRKGVIINIDATVESIRKAVEEAELMAGAEINPALINAGADALGIRDITLLDPDQGACDLCRCRGCEVLEPPRKRAAPSWLEILPDRNHKQW